MPTHPSILAWKISWKRSLVGYSPWGHKELDVTKRLTLLHSVHHRHVRIQVYGADPSQMLLLTILKRNKLGLKGLSPITKVHKCHMSLLFTKSLTKRSHVVPPKHRGPKVHALRPDLGRTRKQLCNSISDYHNNLPIVFLSFLFFKIEA